MTVAARRVRARRDDGESGQAMAEYALIASALTLGFFIFGRSVIVAFLQAYQVYVDSFYMVLALPIP
jgi:Flp pilus assembly pilin Flp